MRGALSGLGPVVVGILVVAVSRLGTSTLRILPQVLITLAAAAALLVSPPRGGGDLGTRRWGGAPALSFQEGRWGRPRGAHRLSRRPPGDHVVLVGSWNHGIARHSTHGACHGHWPVLCQTGNLDLWGWLDHGPVSPCPGGP